MRSKTLVGIIAMVYVISILGLLTIPARAITDGPLRQFLEFNSFGEHLIKSALYARTAHDIYHTEKRKFVNGINVITKPIIYQPDVYTWELAMAAHRRQMANIPPIMEPVAGFVAPMPMEAGFMPPNSPDQVQLTPLGYETVYSRPLPANADEKMQRILARARGAGMNPYDPLQANSIKTRLMSHMNSYGTYYPTTSGVSNAPSVPILPTNLPRGKAADSYDPSY